MSALPQYLWSGAVLGSIYAIFALGFTLLFGTLRVLNLAHGAVFMVGAFVGLASVNAGLPFGVALLFAAIVSGVVSCVIDQVAFRPLRRKYGDNDGSGFATIITSLGALGIIEAVMQQLSDTKLWTFPTPTLATKGTAIGSTYINGLQVFIVVSMLITALAVNQGLRRTRTGIRIRAIAASPTGASLLGINPNRLHLLVFFVAGAIGGFAGTLAGAVYNSVSFVTGQPYLLVGAVIITVGGLGSELGAVLLGLAFGILRTVVTGEFGASVADIITFSVLLVFLVARPQGLLGTFHVAPRAVRQ